MYENYCTVDIETTAIPTEGILAVSKIHCIGVKSNSESTKMYTSRFLPLDNYGGTLRNALDIINTHDYCIGHNFIGFDNIVIANLLGEITATILDSMILAKLLYTKDELKELDYTIPDFPKTKYGSFSLEAFGRRMGIYKDSHSNWNELSIAMADYCTKDVEVTYNLFLNLIVHPKYPSNDIIALENEVAYIIAKQQYYGFHYNIDKARVLMRNLMHEKLTIELKLQKIFKPKYLPDGDVIVPVKARRNKQYIEDLNYIYLSSIYIGKLQYIILKNGKIRFKKYKWFDKPHRILFTYTEGEYQKIKLTKFDPGSRHKIRHWLKTNYNFTFSTFTAKGTPKVEGEELEELGEHGKDLRRYLKIVKDLSQLKGLIDATRIDSTITSRIDTNGTVTGRFTSSSVNLNQIPAQKEFRELFTAPEGWTFVGTDFSGQENVNLAEVLYPFDNGRLDRINTLGDKDLGTDLHSINAQSCGVAREDAKPLWFGFLYGSSATLTGYTLLSKKEFTDYTEEEWDTAVKNIEKRITQPDSNGISYYPVKSGLAAVYVPYTDQLVKQAIFGLQVQSKLIKSTNGLSDLIKYLEKKVKDTGGITTLGGRFIPVSSSHKCLNYFCQGQGAESMKYYLRTIHRKFTEIGLKHGIHFKQQATIYDEVDLIVRNDMVCKVVEILKVSYELISRELNMKCTYSGEVLTGKTWYDCH